MERVDRQGRHDAFRPPFKAPTLGAAVSEQTIAQRAEIRAQADLLSNIAGIQMGLDVGQKQDPSAFCLVEVGERPTTRTYRIRGQTRWQMESTYRVQHMERIDLGTSYVGVAERVAVIIGALWDWERDLRKSGALEPHTPQLPWDLWIDATGVGRPVVEMVRNALDADPKTDRVALHPVVFTWGDRLIRGAYEGDGDSLGKAYLVSNLQVLFQRDVLRLPPDHVEASAMARELQEYEIHITDNANEKYGAFSTGAHDDLVTALGLACLEDPGQYIAQEAQRMW